MRAPSASRDAAGGFERGRHRHRAGNVGGAGAKPLLLPAAFGERLDRDAAAHDERAGAFRPAELVRRDRHQLRRLRRAVDGEPGHRLHRIGVQDRLRSPLAQELADRVERLDRADLVVHEHDRHDDRAVVERVGERGEIDDAVAAGRDPSNAEALALQTVTRREDRLVLEGDRDHTVTATGRSGGSCRALDGQVVGLASTGGEDDLAGARAEGPATASRASSRAVFAARAIACPPDGFPKVPERKGVIAATASGRMGVVAAKSR